MKEIEQLKRLIKSLIDDANDVIFNNEEVAIFMGVCTRTIYNYRKDMNFPYHKIGGQYRYRKIEIIRWITKKKN
jgi:predicted DNA-binding transcriptional regulator AlpA